MLTWTTVYMHESSSATSIRAPAEINSKILELHFCPWLLERPKLRKETKLLLPFWILLRDLKAAFWKKSKRTRRMLIHIKGLKIKRTLSSIVQDLGCLWIIRRNFTIISRAKTTFMISQITLLLGKLQETGRLLNTSLSTWAQEVRAKFWQVKSKLRRKPFWLFSNKSCWRKTKTWVKGNRKARRKLRLLS